MTSILVLGFLMGMSHALEADHLAAMATVSTDRPGSGRKMALRGAFWGAGHTITLFVFGLAVIGFGMVLSDAAAARLEFAVGMMLLVLGASLLHRMAGRRVHFHAHSHAEGEIHIHAHSHAGQAANHDECSHHHQHPNALPWRALMIGLMHGAAGSAGLLTLAIASAQSPLAALAYIVIFGVGSVCGMALLSSVIALPIRLAERSAKAVYLAVTMGAGATAIGVGLHVMVRSGAAAWVL